MSTVGASSYVSMIPVSFAATQDIVSSPCAHPYGLPSFPDALLPNRPLVACMGAGGGHQRSLAYAARSNQATVVFESDALLKLTVLRYTGETTYTVAESAGQAWTNSRSYVTEDYTRYKFLLYFTSNTTLVHFTANVIEHSTVCTSGRLDESDVVLESDRNADSFLTAVPITYVTPLGMSRIKLCDTAGVVYTIVLPAGAHRLIAYATSTLSQHARILVRIYTVIATELLTQLVLTEAEATRIYHFTLLASTPVYLQLISTDTDPVLADFTLARVYDTVNQTSCANTFNDSETPNSPTVPIGNLQFLFTLCAGASVTAVAVKSDRVLSVCILDYTSLFESFVVRLRESADALALQTSVFYRGQECILLDTYGMESDTVYINVYNPHETDEIGVAISVANQCPAGYYHDAGECLHFTQCDHGEFVALPATYTSDTVCMPHTACVVGETVEQTPPTDHTDRVCRPVAACDLDVYYTLASATETSDPVCDLLTVCSNAEYESVAPTISTDRQCSTRPHCLPHESSDPENGYACYCPDDTPESTEIYEAFDLDEVVPAIRSGILCPDTLDTFYFSVSAVYPFYRVEVSLSTPINGFIAFYLHEEEQQVTFPYESINTTFTTIGRTETDGIYKVGLFSAEIYATYNLTVTRLSPCGTGTFTNLTTGECETCPQGTYSNTLYATSCLYCAPGWYAYPGSLACTYCDPGQYLQENEMVHCMDVTECGLDEVETIAPTNYTDRRCSPICAANTILNGETNVCDCVEDGFLTNGSPNYVDVGMLPTTLVGVICPGVHYYDLFLLNVTAGAQYAVTITCSVESCAGLEVTLSDTGGHYELYDSSPFSKVALTDTEDLCTLAMVSDTVVMNYTITISPILPCDLGTIYGTGGAAGQCIECEPGTFANATGLHACFQCPPGSASGPGAGSCTRCFPGTFTATANSGACTFVTDCALGSYERTPPTTTSDRVCAEIPGCDPGLIANATTNYTCHCYDDMLANTDSESAFELTFREGIFSTSPINGTLCPNVTDYFSFNTSLDERQYRVHLTVDSFVPGTVMFVDHVGDVLDMITAQFSGETMVLDSPARDPPGNVYLRITAESHVTYTLSVEPEIKCPPGTFKLAFNTCEHCPAGYFQSRSGEWTCTPCTAGTYSLPSEMMCFPCMLGTYSEAASAECTFCPTGTFANRTGSTECSDVRTCDLPLVELRAPTASTDRLCIHSEGCPSHQYANEDTLGACTNHTECADDMYIVSNATGGHDYICDPISECSITEYEVQAPTRYADRECAPLLVCNSTQYQVRAPTLTSNRECAAHTQCRHTHYILHHPTLTSDRECAPHTVCNDTQYEVHAPTQTSGRECAPHTACNDAQYEVHAPTQTSDRECAVLTVCNDIQYEVHAPTQTSDRECAALTVCTLDEYEDQSPTRSTDRECAALVECTSTQVVVRNASRTSQWECVCRDDTHNNTNSSSPVYLSSSEDTLVFHVDHAVLCPNTSDYYAFYASFVGETYSVRVVYPHESVMGMNLTVTVDTYEEARPGTRVAAANITHHTTTVTFEAQFAGPHLITLHSPVNRTAYELELRVPLVCEPGWYKGGDGHCFPCPRGFFGDVSNALHCAACPAGKYSTTANRECIHCQPGTYSDAEASWACEVCPEGTGTANAGALSCTPCNGTCDPEMILPPPPPPPPRPTYTPTYPELSVFTVQVQLVHSSATPTVDYPLILAALEANFGLRIDFALIPDPYVNWTLSGNVLSLPIISANHATLSVVGRALQARNHTISTGNSTVADFRLLRVFSTVLAKCVMGIYPLLPTNNTVTAYPHDDLVMLGDLPRYSTPPEALTTYTTCPSFACLEGYGGLNCAVQIGSSEPATTPAPVDIPAPKSLSPGEIVGIVIGSVFGVGALIYLCIVLYTKCTSRSHRGYAQAPSAYRF
jgi:hypothetical protein